ncbi:hypothetical protein AR454_16645 [Bacillus mycoides]|uniref:hypothetical protein n=1 Tax=Bacillus mycoides TaxID=1405 RepID=UPI001E371E81|nr:hypothetical protein [Bacillus mycoides]MCD4643716.1 hypothetical protein [Bacillus mycoides]
MTTSEIVIGAVSFFGGLFVMMAKDFFSSVSKETGKIVVELANAEELAMLKAKGTNAATKEDIGEITRGQEAVKAAFQLEMEQHKQELNKLSKEFELYVVKKHEYYPVLYKNILQCILKVTGLRGVKEGIDFRKFTAEEITREMEDRSFTETDKEYVLSNWDDNNKHNAIRHIEKIITEIEYREAKESYIEAHNFFVLHLLYFSDEVSRKGDELLLKLTALWLHYKPDSMQERDKNLEDEIDKMRENLFNQLRKELKNEETEGIAN